MDKIAYNRSQSFGEVIKEELDIRGWGLRDLAYFLGIPEQQVNGIISGSLRIDDSLAKDLGNTFNMSPDFFVNLQKAYCENK